MASPDSFQDGMSGMGANNSDPAFAACAHHWNSRTDSTVYEALHNLLHCLNDTRYTNALLSTKVALTGTRDRELPILAIIIGIYAPFILFGMFGNGLVVYAVYHNPLMRTARNLFIVNLAVSDFTLCAVTQPLNILRLFQNYISWEYGLALCKIVNMLTGVNMFVSTFSITAVAVDRFRVIVYPTRSQISRASLVLCLLGIWGTACLVASPLAAFATIAENHLMIPPVRLCIERTTSWSIRCTKMAYSTVALVIQYLLPLGIVSAAYAVIYRRLKQRARQTKERRALTASASAAVAAVSAAGGRTEREAAEAARQRRATTQLVAIGVAFGLSWLPLSVINIVHDWRVLDVPLVEGSDKESGPQESSDSTFLIVASQCIPLLLVLVSSCLNPVFYGWFNENFQAEFQRILCSNRLAQAGLKLRGRRNLQPQQPPEAADPAGARLALLADERSAPGIPLEVFAAPNVADNSGGGASLQPPAAEVRVQADVAPELEPSESTDGLV